MFETVISTVNNTHLIWKELFVPRWSRSWHKHAMMSARHSISPKIFHHWVAWGTIIDITVTEIIIDVAASVYLWRGGGEKETYYQNGKHHLSYVKGVSPIVIHDVPIVLLHTQYPTTEYVVIDAKMFHEIQIIEHSKARGQCFVVCQIYIVKLEIVQLEMRRWWNSQVLSKEKKIRKVRETSSFFKMSQRKYRLSISAHLPTTPMRDSSALLRSRFVSPSPSQPFRTCATEIQ